MILTPSELSDRIDTLLRADDFGRAAWVLDSDPALNFTYRFETTPAADFLWTNVGGGFSSFPASYKAAFRAALDEVSYYTNLTFSEDTGAGDADFSFYRAADLYTDSPSSGGGRGGWSYSGNEWDASSVYNSALALDAPNRFDLIIHEIGHMLGLKHPGDYSVSGNPQNGPFLPAGEDNDRYTVMSYNENNVTGQESRHYMLYDIAAMQQFWGANMNSATGDDTYTGPDDGRVQVIWDAGGEDMFEFTGMGNAVIDLRQGAFSSLGALDNLAIAYETVIENATGGSGDDSLRGNSADNVITGNGGDDTIIASGGKDRVFDGAGDDSVNLGSGNDYVRAGGGADSYDGGSGSDYISYYDSSGGVTLNLETDSASGSWANNDSVEDFENASGSRTGNDEITGTSGANRIKTYGGDDRVFDGGGADEIELGSGDDYVRAGGGADSYDGGSGNDYISYYDSSGGVTLNLETDSASGSWANNDTIEDFESASGSRTGDDEITGTSGANTIKTYGGDDRVWDGSGADSIDLGSGDDYVRVGGGQDSYDGGSGSDYISYYDSSGGVTLNLDTDTVTGSWANNDMVVNFEGASGSRTGDDAMNGTSGANVFRTYGGNDFVQDQGGNDLVELGSGNDTVIAGGGRDTYEGGSGADLIDYSFSSGGVQLDLAADSAAGSWASNDIIDSFEGAIGSNAGDDDLRGTSGQNLLRGYGGDDSMWGRSGDDTLSGEDGEDRFDGGHGDDVLYGGADADVFHFDRGEDHDTIGDFENNVDTIELDNFSFAPGEDAFDFATQDGAHVAFDFGGGDMLTVLNVTIAQLVNDVEIV